jgi:hypothetical protein
MQIHLALAFRLALIWRAFRPTTRRRRRRRKMEETSGSSSVDTAGAPLHRSKTVYSIISSFSLLITTTTTTTAQTAKTMTTPRSYHENAVRITTQELVLSRISIATSFVGHGQFFLNVLRDFSLQKVIRH